MATIHSYRAEPCIVAPVLPPDPLWLLTVAPAASPLMATIHSYRAEPCIVAPVLPPAPSWLLFRATVQNPA